MRCPGCGEKVSPSYDFCPRCGHSLNGSEPRMGRTDAETPRRSGGGCLRAFLISFTLVLLAGSAVAGWYWYTCYYDPVSVVVTPQLRDVAQQFDVLGEYYDGIAQVRRGDVIAYINTAGEVVDAPDRKPGASMFHTPDETGLIRVEREGRWGMIDRETRDTVIRPLYTTLGSFYNGLALATVKFGDRSMPEYLCYYGYVDVKGHHTFTPEQFKRIEQARMRAERREYLESLPQGITARCLGLPAGVAEAVVADSTGRLVLRFNREGVLTHYDDGTGAHYGVSGGYVTSMSVRDADGVIRSYRFLREKVDDIHQTIIRQGADGRRRVGEVCFSADDGTVAEVAFLNLCNLAGRNVRIKFY